MAHNVDDFEVALSHVSDVRQTVPNGTKEAYVDEKAHSISVDTSSLYAVDVDDYPDQPTEEELRTLPRVSGQIPWSAYTIAFVELCERLGYYGTTAVFTNFIQQPLPPNFATGAGGDEYQSGALGMGQRASTGLQLFNSFWSYCMPLLGAYIADQYLGRYNTIMMAIAIAIVGHGILVVSAIPAVISSPNGAIAAFVVGLLVLGVGTGCFKANISPLIAEQNKEKKMRVITDKNGKRLIVDPQITVGRLFLYFYMCINIGSLVGSIGMVYAERYVGFWLSFLLPTMAFCLTPFVLFACRNMYNRTPPTGSVLSKFLHLSAYAWKQSPSKGLGGFRDDHFWDRVKPSKVVVQPAWMADLDDAWVDQVKRGLAACKVFLWTPIYFLAYNQMTGNLTSQAATMQLGGVPNDIINNLNPISLIVFIPLVDHFLYPGLRKAGIHFTPIKRIFTGFMLATLAMISATVTQYYIYKLGPCGDEMNSCDEAAPINVWVQTLPYVLIGLSEIFTNITALEYAFTKAPTNMRSLVMAINLFMSAISAALSQALVSLSEDPLLVWNYAATSILALLGGLGFWLTMRGYDGKEDAMNMLPESGFGGRGGGGGAKGKTGEA